ncbi:hypothetical protein CBS115989_1477 [Aspergillus niger]|uniref:Contig An14c0200, genomic contig n=2 Tax=Aspergillus niger TaxID=5061 RepID=A2R4A2_ASPNC|nr:uncharacterized protein An14g07090 [Aspergillus niger]KAI2823495.1 hypothetical protein CBS115989_1477 [Aspergillus niger]KAI2825590.1 hypothetical protein CBS133816_8348 [Aspergillus niger]KAI2846456.1 hypothetical protein CBS11232_7406 [Aspergillus niger]KAI2846853.1 hypothetical protein CBS11350_3384 [Aspergillus niger]KAI2876084.1 hypothetical protein CBS115988_4865 [Aspergillus niger]
MDNPNRLVVGLDHALTYWAQSRGEVVEWQPVNRIPITPSVMAYPDNRPPLWGNAAREHRDRVSWSKLLVDGSPPVSVNGLDLRALLGDKGFNYYQDRTRITRVITDYLERIRSAFCNDPRVLEDVRALNLSSIAWHFSMPACWSRNGVRMMMIAVERAGFLDNGGTITYCSEAMAAAIGVSYRLTDNSVRVGEKLLVCDLGGVTNVRRFGRPGEWFKSAQKAYIEQDFTTFKVTGVDPNHPRRLSFQQIAQHSTADCTNPHIENELLQHIRQVLGLPLRSGDVARLAVEAARAAKEGYNGRDDVDVRLSLRQRYLQQHYNGNCRFFDHDGGRFTFSASVLQGAMDPVVTSVMRRILDHVKTYGANRIAIVGGLSRSQYFQRRIQADFANIPEVSHLLPVNYFGGYDPMTIVSYGLTRKGIAPNPMQYRSRWGYEIHSSFIERLGTEDLYSEYRPTTAITLVEARDNVPRQGRVRFRLSVRSRHRSENIMIKRRDMAGKAETVTLCPHEIDDNTPYVDEAVHRDLNVTVRYYEIVASWSLEADVHLTMDWTFEAEGPRTGVLHEVARASHPADEMMPCWAT